MIQRMANAVSRRALLGVAGAVLSLLLVDGALVSASRGEGTAPVGLLQTVHSGAQMAVDGSLRFLYDMQAVYHLTHLEEIVPATGKSEPRSEARSKLYLCSDARPAPAPAKTVI